jgi:methionyl-tRNA synthetase
MGESSMNEIVAPESTKTMVATADSKPDNIPYEDFAKLDIRVGTITKSENIPKSKKLLKLEVFFGPEVGHRVILAGIAESFFEASSVVGMQITAVLNLAPRTMMGVQSHGMLLAGRWLDGRLALVQCLGVPDGGSIG